MTVVFWTLDRVAAALGAGPGGQTPIRAVSTDTRTISHGDVFVALKGESFDGHDHLSAAVERGAVAVVASQLPRGASLGVPVYQVPDTLVALGQLAAFWRKAWGKPVVGVAGSNGKTSTKDLIRAALGSRLAVHATTGNLNNRIGVPLTILSIPRDSDIAVVELGTSLPGEVALLREIAGPDIAVVTSVAEEHLEGLGDLAGVLREEAACYDGVEVGIAPASQPELVEAARARARSVVSTGLDEGDLRARAWRIGPDGLGEIEIDGATVRSPLRGAHNLRNAMLALAVARSCGVTMEDAARGIAAMPQPRMRTAWEQLGKATLINDAYNSNPGSARAAIELVRGAGDTRQRVVVLGTMRELGPGAAQCHSDIARLAVESGADIVAGIGDFAAALEGVPAGTARVVAAEDVDDLWPRLEPLLKPDALILLKASRGVRLERLVPYLTTWAEKC
ncbi:MAG TPA: UDP-N-acetylmuramoyl-tripeptide--D-alanyl-D-alanine ligase [Gemmatimonadaceae bacterium]|nr:UDP-N-acetylmuramoyl-tripeptide--D-alanyl-D-alanine ligase [Gemmatimonadaceae bacterium]